MAENEIVEKDTMTEQEFIIKRDTLLQSWEGAKVALETAKEAEMDLRKEIVAFVFDKDKKAGTERVELGNGYEIKTVKKLNYNLNQDAVNAALDAIENIDAEGKFIAERLVKWKADLSMTEYKLLAPKYKVLIDKAITTSEGAPTLEIISPKNTKKL